MLPAIRAHHLNSQETKKSTFCSSWSLEESKRCLPFSSNLCVHVISHSTQQQQLLQMLMTDWQGLLCATLTSSNEWQFNAPWILGFPKPPAAVSTHPGNPRNVRVDPIKPKIFFMSGIANDKKFMLLCAFAYCCSHVSTLWTQMLLLNTFYSWGLILKTHYQVKQLFLHLFFVDYRKCICPVKYH